MSNEKGVADYYDKTTAAYCVQVTLTLGLHSNAPFSEWCNLVSWTRSISSSGYAIMDGLLCFKKSHSKTKVELEDAVADTIKKEYSDVFKEMRKSKSSSATWEMKSLSAGPIEAMTSVPNLGNFDWTYCIPTEAKRHQKAKDGVKMLNVRPDTKTPPWTLPVRSYSLKRKK